MRRAPGQQVVHAADLDRLIGLDVAREGADLRLQAAARAVVLSSERRAASGPPFALSANTFAFGCRS